MKVTIHNGPGSRHTEGQWTVELVGDDGEWTVTVRGISTDEEWEGEWDPKTREIIVMGANINDEALEQRFVHGAQVFLQRTLDKRHVPQQEVLGLDGVPGCCQCGATEVPNDLGVEIDGVKQYGIVEKVTWLCITCGGLVCRNCCQTIPNSRPTKYYDNTYCSEICRACTTPGRAAEDKEDY